MLAPIREGNGDVVPYDAARFHHLSILDRMEVGDLFGMEIVGGLAQHLSFGQAVAGEKIPVGELKTAHPILEDDRIGRVLDNAANSLLAVAKRLLGSFLLGHVLGNTGDAVDLAVGVAHRESPVPDQPDRPVGVNHAVLRIVGALRLPSDVVNHLGAVVRVDGVHEGHGVVIKAFATASPDLLIGGTDIKDFILLQIGHPENLGNVLAQLPKQRLAFTQGALGGVPVRQERLQRPVMNRETGDQHEQDGVKQSDREGSAPIREALVHKQRAAEHDRSFGDEKQRRQAQHELDRRHGVADRNQLFLGLGRTDFLPWRV